MSGCNKKINGTFSTVIIILASIGLVSIIGFLLGNLVLIPDSDAIDHAIPTDKHSIKIIEQEDLFVEIKQVKELYYFEMFRDCLVFDNFSDYSEKFYTYPVPRPCFVIIEDGNVSINSSEDYPSYIIDCEVVSKDKWDNIQRNHIDGFNYSEKKDVGCFFEQSYLDLNKSFFDIYYVEKPL